MKASQPPRGIPLFSPRRGLYALILLKSLYGERTYVLKSPLRSLILLTLSLFFKLKYSNQKIETLLGLTPRHWSKTLKEKTDPVFLNSSAPPRREIILSRQAVSGSKSTEIPLQPKNLCFKPPLTVSYIARLPP